MGQNKSRLEKRNMIKGNNYSYFPFLFFYFSTKQRDKMVSREFTFPIMNNGEENYVTFGKLNLF